MLYLCLILSLLQVNASSHHLDPETTSFEYQRLLDQQRQKNVTTLPQFNKRANPNPILNAIELGDRNLEWLKIINHKRVKNRQTPLSFWDPKTTLGHPIENPRTYGPLIIEENLKKALKDMPSFFRKTLESSGKLPDEPMMPAKDYIQWGREVDLLYQLSVRWQLLIPWKDNLALAKKSDVRGIYFLEKEPDLERKLRGFLSLPPADQKRLRSYLYILCQNTEGVTNDSCEAILDLVIIAKKVFEFYLQYKVQAEKIWDGFFAIENPRNDLSWRATDPNNLYVPFRAPKDKVIEDFLRDNIQDEWKFLNWKLLLNFNNSARIHVDFIPNENPHVDKLGGDRIVMNANAPLTEYDVRWTIRHEFGHTLGFHDCYIEFYIPKENIMMSYQLDLTNLMCSRQGHFKQIHYDLLKKHYLKP